MSFFTAPEFYWNIPFGDFWTEAELETSTDLYLPSGDIRNARDSYIEVSSQQYGGDIVLLPGTVAALKKSYECQWTSKDLRIRSMRH